ncbi:MAG: glycoside hydrolase family 16 protein [Lachnospiraceae bacterium]|nr:glycoside hydrolase family 16 protein [Lachnospiraceae bacterium]
MGENRVKDGYTLVWEENFDYEGSVCAQDWSCEVGERWANNEQQAYTDSLENVCVRDGKLFITARKETYGIRDYTSGRITTAGKHSFLYGYFEIRAKLPKGHGSWPAIWMMPDSSKQGNPWPHCGEIDIMEHIGRREDSIWFSLHSERHNHTRKDTKQYTTIREYENVCSEFHTYGMEWMDGAIEFFVDGKSACIYRRTDDEQDWTETAWPFDQPFYLIINIAVGGGLGGEIHEEELPYEMVVDYVRVYQKKG